VIILAFLLGGIVAIASAVVWRALQWLEDQRTRPQRWTTVPDPRPREHPEPSHCELAANVWAIHADLAANQPELAASMYKCNAQVFSAAFKVNAYGQPPHGPMTLARLSPQRLASDLRSDWRPERN
jgi:hypothetical protein